MTVTSGSERRSRRQARGPRHRHHRRLRGQRPQGHPAHPRRGAARDPDPPILRSPPAGPGRGVSPVPGGDHGRGERARNAQARRVLHHHRLCRHGGQDPAHFGGVGQGAAGRHGDAADQPPPGLPDLRQGRGVPTAEPGDEQRPGRSRGSRATSARFPSRSTFPRRCCSTGSAACCAPAAPVFPTRSRETRLSRCSSAVPSSRSASIPSSHSSRTSRGTPIQICPVGALTGAAYRFRARPFDLVSSPGVCEHCASGCAIRTDHRRGKVLRRLAGDDPQVNEEWNCDKGRWAFQYATAQDRLTTPLVRDEQTGELVAASWPEALELAARGLAAARDGRGAAVLVGGRVTHEDAYAYAKFARVALRTNDVDFRARPHSAEEEAFLGVVSSPGGARRSPTPTSRPPRWSCSPGWRPRRSRRSSSCGCARPPASAGWRCFGLAPFATRGLDKTLGRLIPTAPGDEAAVLAARISGHQPRQPACGRRGARGGRARRHRGGRARGRPAPYGRRDPSR